MKAKILFLGVTFFTLTFWQWAYYRFAQHFNGLPEAQTKISLLEEDLARERAINGLLDYRLSEFRESVAEVLPQFKTPPYTESEVKVRELASVVRKSDGAQIEKATQDSKIELAAKKFADGEFQASIQILSPLTRGALLSANAVRAHFILAESYFQEQMYPECLAEVRTMLEQFPDSEMTGYLILRMGQILTGQKRIDEAEEAFSIVEKSFRDEKLQSRARLLTAQLKNKALE